MTWHRFHPLTPFLRGGVMIAAVFGWLLSQQFSRVFGAPLAGCSKTYTDTRLSAGSPA